MILAIALLVILYLIFKDEFKYSSLFILKPLMIPYKLHPIYTRRPTIYIENKKIKINRGYKQFKQMNRKTLPSNNYTIS